MSIAVQVLTTPFPYACAEYRKISDVECRRHVLWDEETLFLILCPLFCLGMPLFSHLIDSAHRHMLLRNCTHEESTRRSMWHCSGGLISNRDWAHVATSSYFVQGTRTSACVHGQRQDECKLCFTEYPSELYFIWLCRNILMESKKWMML